MFIAMHISPDACLGGGEDARRRSATLTLAVSARIAEAWKLWVSVACRLPRASEAYGLTQEPTLQRGGALANLGVVKRVRLRCFRL